MVAVVDEERVREKEKYVRKIEVDVEERACEHKLYIRHCSGGLVDKALRGKPAG